MTKDEVAGLSYILNYLGDFTVSKIFKEIFLIDENNVIRGFNKVALRNYADRSKLKTFYAFNKSEDKDND